MLHGAGHGQPLCHPQLDEKEDVSGGAEGRASKGGWRVGLPTVTGVSVCVCVCREWSPPAPGQRELEGDPSVLRGDALSAEGKRERSTASISPEARKETGVPHGRGTVPR